MERHNEGFLTLVLVRHGRSALLSCGEPAGLLTWPLSTACAISGDDAFPLSGVVGADSDCLPSNSSANHTLFLILGGVPEEQIEEFTSFKSQE